MASKLGTTITTSRAPLYHTTDGLRRMTQIFVSTMRYMQLVNRSEKRGELSNELLSSFMKEWSARMCDLLNLEVEQIGQPTIGEPAILVGNHVSYLDIPLIMSLVPAVFVAKKQVGSWPLFGAAARSVGTILVDRDSKDSRQNITNVVAPFMKRRKLSVVIFPSGTTCLEEKKPWRWGAFRIAQEAGIPVQPFRVRYQPARAAAYLMEDAFVSHLWRVLVSPGLRATVEFLPPFRVENPEIEAYHCWQWARDGLQTEMIRSHQSKNA